MPWIDAEHILPVQWPHNTGPMLTYMAPCEGTTCDKYDASGAKWFKIDQLGKKDSDTWWQADIRECLLKTLFFQESNDPRRAR